MAQKARKITSLCIHNVFVSGLADRAPIPLYKSENLISWTFSVFSHPNFWLFYGTFGSGPPLSGRTWPKTRKSAFSYIRGKIRSVPYREKNSQNLLRVAVFFFCFYLFICAECTLRILRLRVLNVFARNSICSLFTQCDFVFSDFALVLGGLSETLDFILKINVWLYNWVIFIDLYIRRVEISYRMWFWPNDYASYYNITFSIKFSKTFFQSVGSISIITGRIFIFCSRIVCCSLTYTLNFTKSPENKILHGIMSQDQSDQLTPAFL